MCEWLEDDDGNRTFVIYPTGWDIAYNRCACSTPRVG
jgi:hypothetical protein